MAIDDSEIVLPVTMKVTPQTLNLERHGRWVKVHLQDDSANSPQEMSVTLDSSGSADSKGDTLIYDWTVTDADGNEIAVSDDAVTTVTLPAGEYTVRLVVNDGTADSETAEDSFTLTAQTIEDLLAADPATYTINDVAASEVKGDADCGVVVISFACNAIAETVDAGLEVEMVLEGTASGIDKINVIQDKQNGDGNGKSELKGKK